MSVFDKIRKLFTPPSADVLAVKHLEESKRQLLAAFAYREEADAMVKKYQERVRRLETAVQKIAEKPDA